MDKNNVGPQLCSGCGGCVEVCPVGAIRLKRDAQGFYRAMVDEKSCIGCGLCVKSCSMNRKAEGNGPLKSYAAYNREADIRQKSSSGGIFTALANQVIAGGGVVVGAAFDENMHLKHVFAENQDQLEALRGSKYLQSDMRGVYPAVKELLETGRQVLFVGTPCQVAGLHTALGKKYDNLLTCDLVCHGAPSSGLFEGYFAYLEKKHRGKIVGYGFRSKEQANARMSYTVKLTMEDGTIHYISGDEEPYTMRFISGALQAESCYACPYTSCSRVADLTLGDYWGYEQAHPELAQIQGVSLVLVNTPAGERLLSQAEELELVDTAAEQYLKHNHHLSAPGKKHPQRDGLYRAFADTGFTNSFYKKQFLPEGYGMYILKRRILALIKRR